MENIMLISSEKQLGDALSAQGSVCLVYFSAAWCAPCKHLYPLLEKAVSDDAFLGLTVCKVDVDAQGAIASRFNVRSIPTLYLYANGAQKAVQMGLVDYDRLKAFIAQAYD